MKKLLLLEDDPVLGQGLKLLFELEAFSVSWFKNIADAKHQVQLEEFDIAILDVGLPDGSGIDFCAWLRKFTYNFPIIMLTAQTDEDSVIAGLTNGANDYVKKPFSNNELVARVKANTREFTTDKTLQIGSLNINEEKRSVQFPAGELKLNRKEFDILLLFAKRKDAIISRELIIERALGNIEVSDRTVDSHISHIRSKLQKEGIEDVTIASEYGIGYRLKVSC